MFRKAKAKLEKAKAESKKAEAKPIKSKTVSFSKELVVKDILKQARSLKMSEAAVNKFAEIVAERTEKWVNERAGITENDLNSKIAKEIRRYSTDLAFIYENRGKII